MSTEGEVAVTPHQPVSPSRRSSIASTLNNHALDDVGGDSPAALEKSQIPNGHDIRDTVVIDWDGPDDPENPKK